MLRPVNRHIVIENQRTEVEEESVVLLPEGYTPPQQDYSTAKVLSVADDVSFECEQGDTILLDKRMVTEIDLGNETITMILENYVLGVL